MLASSCDESCSIEHDVAHSTPSLYHWHVGSQGAHSGNDLIVQAHHTPIDIDCIQAGPQSTDL